MSQRSLTPGPGQDALSRPLSPAGADAFIQEIYASVGGDELPNFPATMTVPTWMTPDARALSASTPASGRSTPMSAPPEVFTGGSAAAALRKSRSSPYLLRRQSRRSSGKKAKPGTKTAGGKPGSHRTRIEVCVRMRPLTPLEIQREEVSTWDVRGDAIAAQARPGQPGPGPQQYRFDHVCGPEVKTSGVYERLVHQRVGGFMRGTNATIMAYGQTSSGKTYTMMGDVGNPGVSILVVDDIFRLVKENPGKKYALTISYFEIYNEEIFDLLASGKSHKSLRLRESKSRGVYVDGLERITVKTKVDVLELIKRGERHRHLGFTIMNHESSRSHTILSVEVRVTHPNSQRVRRGILNLVDLAGSERVSVHAYGGGGDGAAIKRKEGGFINKSLYFLGNVIVKLSQKQGSAHIPYRNSKLTRILKQSLGGNSRTIIICCITPSDKHYAETVSTLKFAGFAKRITNRVETPPRAPKLETTLETARVKSFWEEATALLNGIYDDDSKLKPRSARSLQRMLGMLELSERERDATRKTMTARMQEATGELEKVAALADRVRELEGRRDELEAQNIAALAELQKTRTRASVLPELSERARRLAREKAALSQRLAEADRKEREVRSGITEKVSQVGRLRAELRALAEQSEKVKKELGDLEGRAQERERALTQQLADRAREIERLRAAKERSDAALLEEQGRGDAKARAERTRVEAATRAEKERLERVVEELKADLLNKQYSHEVKTRALGERERVTAELEADLLELREEVRSGAAQRRALEKQKRTAEEMLAHTNIEFTLAKKRVRALEAEVKERRARIVEVESRNTALEGKLTEKSAAVSRLERDRRTALDAIRSEHALALETAKRESIAEGQALRERLATAVRAREAAEGASLNLEKRARSLQNALDEKVRAVDLLESRLGEQAAAHAESLRDRDTRAQRMSLASEAQARKAIDRLREADEQRAREAEDKKQRERELTELRAAFSDMQSKLAAAKMRAQKTELLLTEVKLDAERKVQSSERRVEAGRKSAEGELRAAMGQLQQERNETDRLRKRCAQLESDASEREREVLDLKQRQVGVVAKRDTELSKIRAEAREAARTVISLRESLAVVEADNKRSNEALGRARAEASRIKIALDEKAAELAQSARRAGEAAADKARLQASFAEKLEGMQRAFAEKFSELNRNVQSRESLIEKWRGVSLRLQQELEAAKRETNIKEGEKTEAERRLAEATARVTWFEKQSEKNRRELSALEVARSKQILEAREHQLEKERLSYKLADLASSAKGAEEKRADAVSKLLFAKQLLAFGRTQNLIPKPKPIGSSRESPSET